MIKTLEWTGNSLRIIDQTQLPGQMTIIELKELEDIFEAITALRIRGAPAIGVAAAYGTVLAYQTSDTSINDIIERLKQSRPTAVNLFWALERMQTCYLENEHLDKTDQLEHLEKEAISIHNDDIDKCRLIGEYGSTLIEDGMNVMTYCNTGHLATAGIGTALGVIITAHQQGKKLHVFVNETRPLLQGARLTAWELEQYKIPYTLITDNMAAHTMKQDQVDLVITGADRIAANGDSANKIGTYSLAIAANAHTLPFFVAAPTSTIDIATETGEDILIEQRNSIEVTSVQDCHIAPEDAQTYNPAFDVTPNHLIQAIITEEGIIKADYKKSITHTMQRTENG